MLDGVPMGWPCAALWSCGLTQLPSAMGAVLSCLLLLSLGSGTLTAVLQLIATSRFLRRALQAPRVAPSPRLQDLAQRFTLAAPLDVYDAPEPWCFCYGFLRPRIYLSQRLADRLTDRELAAVLCHEQYHARARHPLLLWLVRGVAAAGFFVPLAAHLRERFLVWAELLADADAIQRLGDQTPLASALYTLLTWPDVRPMPTQLAIGSLSVADARIDRLLNAAPARPSARPWSTVVGSVGVLALLLAAVLSAMLSPTVPFVPMVSCVVAVAVVSTTV